jgi:hypothetical protein
MQAITSKVSDAARTRVRARLRGRVKVPLSGSARDQLTAPASENGTSLAQALANLIGVEVEQLRRDDKLREILRVHRNELPADVQRLLPKIGLSDVVDPFAFALLDFVEKRIGEDPSRVKRAPFVPLPTSEDEWIDRILSMTVGELLGALA